MSTPNITLLRTDSNADPAAVSIVHNKNAKIIEDALNQLRYDLDNIDITSSITPEQFMTMMQNSKNYVMIRANMVNNESIDFNEYRITRLDNPAGWPSSSVEFRVTDTNIERNMDFRKSFVHIRDFAGYAIYPAILADATFVSIIFSDSADVSPTGINPLSDSNNKRLIIF